MGQYYLAVNVDKKEMLCIDGKKIGGKLVEIAFNKKECSAILNQIAGAWNGDRIFLVGDYADQRKSNEKYYQIYRKLESEFHLERSFYYYILDSFKKVDGSVEDKKFRYIYNHSKKVYIDLRHCPKCCEENSWRQEYISPLPILIAMGNGLGGGDYYNRENEYLAGAWCDSIASVEITSEPKDELGYEEFRPDFYYPW